MKQIQRLQKGYLSKGGIMGAKLEDSRENLGRCDSHIHNTIMS